MNERLCRMKCMSILFIHSRHSRRALETLKGSTAILRHDDAHGSSVDLEVAHVLQGRVAVGLAVSERVWFSAIVIIILTNATLTSTGDYVSRHITCNLPDVFT